MRWRPWGQPYVSAGRLMKRYTDEVLIIYDSDEAGVKAGASRDSYAEKASDSTQK